MRDLGVYALSTADQRLVGVLTRKFRVLERAGARVLRSILVHSGRAPIPGAPRASAQPPELTLVEAQKQHRTLTAAAPSVRTTFARPFITLSLANGRTETWVQDRTGV